MSQFIWRNYLFIIFEENLSIYFFCANLSKYLLIITIYYFLVGLELSSVGRDMYYICRGPVKDAA
jgi:hypothetical protein